MDERKYKVNDNFLDEIKKEQAYFLGIIASDGCIRKFPKCQEPYRAFSLTQSGQHGLELIKYIKNLLKSDCKIYHYKKTNSYTIQITSEKLTKNLIDLGITPSKTLTLRFPECIDKNLAPDFMRGYIDGDGCVGIYKRGAGEYLNISFVGTKNFTEKSLEYIPYNVNLSFNHIKRCKNLYTVGMNGLSAENFGSWVYRDETLFMGKKYKIYKQYLENYNPPYREHAKKQKLAYDMYKDGVSVSKIANELGVAFQTIYKWRNKFEWPR